MASVTVTFPTTTQERVELAAPAGNNGIRFTLTDTGIDVALLVGGNQTPFTLEFREFVAWSRQMAVLTDKAYVRAMA